EGLAALPRRHSGHHLGAVLQHLAGMERAIAARDPLHHQATRLVDENAHAAPFTTATTCRTASSMSESAVMPMPRRILTASASLVPVSRTTMGTFTGNWESA